MHQARNIIDDIYYVGASDRRLHLFENVYPIPNGVSYNSYLVMDEKTVLLDTVDASVSKAFFENVENVLNGRPLDYVIVNHMEPDHAATLSEVVLRHPETTIIGNAKTFQMIRQFFTFDLAGRTMEVKEGDCLCSGKHNFAFYTAAMVHWPEVMVTYDSTSKALFSADAFGTFGALSGNLYADEVDFETELLDEARRYYTNIVGKYGIQVQALLNKAAGLDIEYLFPLHGPIWREPKKITWFVEKYSKWATYTPEDDEVVIFYGSVYGNTENAAMYLANELAKRNLKHIKMYDVAGIDKSYLVSECFRAKALVFASASYNGSVFTPMEDFLNDLRLHNFQKRTVAIIENGTWAVTAGKTMKEIFAAMKHITIMDDMLTIKSSLKEDQVAALEKMADDIVALVESN